MSSLSNPCWEHASRQVDKANGQIIAICKHCNKAIKCTNRSPTNFVSHLKTKHKIIVKTKKASSTTKTNENNNPSPNVVIDLDLEQEVPVPATTSSTSTTATVATRKTITDYYRPDGQDSIEECVSCLAIDFVSINMIAKNPFIRSSFRQRGMELPVTPSQVMKLIHKDANNKREQVSNILKQMVNEGKKFSLIIDELSSLRRRRYFNITLNEPKSTLSISLGLVRIFGSFTSEACAEQVEKHLKKFGLVMKQDIVATVNDGTSVMKKYGRIVGLIMQLCLNHGIHLSVEDVIYKKQPNPIVNVATIEPIDDSEEQNDDFEDPGDGQVVRTSSNVPNFIDELDNVRKLINFIRKSSIRNEYCVKLSNTELALDVRNRWNSISNMLRSVIISEDAIRSTLETFNALHYLEGVDFDELKVIYKVMEPIKLAVEALSRDDANLEIAEQVIKYMFEKLEEANGDEPNSGSGLAQKLIDRLRVRVDERENKTILSLLKSLRDPHREISIEALQLGQSLLKRLYPGGEEGQSQNQDDGDVVMHADNENETLSMQDQLNAAIESAGKEKTESSYSSIAEEFRLFRLNGKRTRNLQRLLDALLTIKPTSTDVERVFSAAVNFCTKIRSRLADSSLDDLIFLRYFYKSLTKRWKT